MHTEVSKALAEHSSIDEGEASPFEETPAQMVARVCRPFDAKGKVVVINDEAHHCPTSRAGWRTRSRRPTSRGDDKKDAKRREREGEPVVQGRQGDRRSPWGAGHLRPLGDAPIPPRVGAHRGDALPLGRVRLLPRRGHRVGPREGPGGPGRRRQGVVRGPRRSHALGADARLVEEPRPLRQEHPRAAGARAGSSSRYDGCTTSTARPTRSGAKRCAPGTGFIAPPVFIVVCQNTKHSKVLFDLIAGYRKGEQWIPGKLPLFSNVDDQGAPLARPNTILVDSEQLESGEAVSKDFLDAAEVRDRGVQARVPSHEGSRRGGEDHRGRPAARGAQHRRAPRGSSASRCAACLRLDAHRGVGRQHGQPHLRAPRVLDRSLLCEQVVGPGFAPQGLHHSTPRSTSRPRRSTSTGFPSSSCPARPSRTSPRSRRRSGTRSRMCPSA
jgi:type III restriction enzyme